MWPFKKHDNRHNHSFDDDDREVSRRVRELKLARQQLDFERAKMEHELNIERIRAEIMDLRGDEEEPENNSSPADAMMMSILSSIMSKGSPAVVSTSLSTTAGISLSDEQLNQMWSEVPKPARKIAKTWTDQQIKDFLIARLPGVNADTQERAVRLVRL